MPLSGWKMAEELSGHPDSDLHVRTIFLDPIVDKIIHIRQQTLFEVRSNYSAFEVQRATHWQQQAIT